ncbi:MAG: hypothetical protein ABSB87_00245 [Terriglobales bacterium]|jgi:hypothetical protein
MPTRITSFHALPLACFVLVVALSAWMPAGAQANPNPQKQNPAGEARQSSATPGSDYSGMYGFLRDGEFVQLTVEDHGHVIGFVSRYANSEADSGFLEHFLKSGKVDGNELVFTSESVHGVSFEFNGTIERGEGKSRGDEGYYVLKGTLVENTTDNAKKTSSQSHEVVLKSFPQDLAPPPEKK